MAFLKLWKDAAVVLTDSGALQGVGGTILTKIFSRETDDEVFGTLYYADGKSAQISVNWNDESCRKMTTRITIWGTAGRIYADRQECQVFLRDTAQLPAGYEKGWNVRLAPAAAYDVIAPALRIRIEIENVVLNPVGMYKIIRPLLLNFPAFP